MALLVLLAFGGVAASTGAGGVTRRVEDIRGPLAQGTRVAFDQSVWEGNPRSARAFPYREIEFPSQLGPMPAWRVPGRGGTWAIFVHGHNAERNEGLRVLASLRRAGLPSLLISYRNDPGAPPSEDGLLHLGQTEWRDVESAARYAVRRGARSLVLVGASMGGAIVSQFIHALPRRVTFHRVRGAGHVEAWNVDPAVYDRRVAVFLRRALPPQGG